MQSIYSLENAHKGEDVIVVGGGKSLDYFPKSFFDGRIVIAVNQAASFVPHHYVVRKEGVGVENTIVSRRFAGMSHGAENIGAFFFDHNHNELSIINEDGLHPNGDKIVVSWSTITSAIHLAAFMGARSVFLVGHDCAGINGEYVADGYYDGVRGLTNKDSYPDWVGSIAPQTVHMRDYLEKWYGVPLITLSPFIGLKHEGHDIV